MKGLTYGRPGVPGKPGRPGKPGIPGNPGYFKMHFYNLRTKSGESITLPKGFTSHYERHYRFSVNSKRLHVDLDEGNIILGPKLEDPIQHIVLAFVTSMLYLMVQPRPADVESAINRAKTMKMKSKPMYFDTGDVAFFMLCGWNVRNHVPTNSTLRFCWAIFA